MTARPILVTGGSGQVASALDAAATLPVRVVGRPDFDFDRPDTIAATFHATEPWLVVNAAAYTGVDAAENDEATAFRANRDGPAALARLCATAGIPLIHISTDYVFDGTKGAPYVETDPVAPQCVYGASKLAGEQAVLEACPRAVVLRTSWVYGPRGKNFVLTMLNLGRTRDRLTVVSDQKGCPTAAADLAAAILAMAERIGASGWSDAYAGVFHAAGSGWTTWHGLATAVFDEAGRHGAPVPRVDPIATADWPTPARRPADSRLDCGKLAAVWGIALPGWRTSLRRTVEQVCAKPVPPVAGET
ncbi:MAG TPA: dTDP-4-dehydrorhamnose reductase [Acetobacteraceae bacterium]|nr:dTDP-4-dehydrorhamnose reductase [Acetobacteraceae bacterium]